MEAIAAPAAAAAHKVVYVAASLAHCARDGCTRLRQGVHVSEDYARAERRTWSHQSDVLRQLEGIRYTVVDADVMDAHPCCLAHTCAHKGCTSAATENTPYCPWHVCMRCGSAVRDGCYACDAHVCAVEGCPFVAANARCGSFCRKQHKCLFAAALQPCDALRAPASEFCHAHTCVVTGCDGAVATVVHVVSACCAAHDAAL